MFTLIVNLEPLIKTSESQDQWGKSPEKLRVVFGIEQQVICRISRVGCMVRRVTIRVKSCLYLPHLPCAKYGLGPMIPSEAVSLLVTYGDCTHSHRNSVGTMSQGIVVVLLVSGK